MNWGDNLALILSLLALVGTLVATSASLAWFISSQFSKTREQFWKALEKMSDGITQKLEYHERHDDERFDKAFGFLHAIHLRNARRDGDLPPDLGANGKT